MQLAIEARTRVLASNLVLDLVDERFREEAEETPEELPKKAVKKGSVPVERNGKSKKQDAK